MARLAHLDQYHCHWAIGLLRPPQVLRHHCHRHWHRHCLPDSWQWPGPQTALVLRHSQLVTRLAHRQSGLTITAAAVICRSELRGPGDPSFAGPGNPSFAPFCMASCRQSTVPLCGGASLRQMHRYVAVLSHHLRSIVATTPGVSWLAVVRSRVSAGWL